MDIDVCGFLKLVLRTLIVFAVASDAVTLRSCDGVDHSVDTLSAIAHSGLLKGLIGGPNSSDALIPLPEVANSELLSIARFINVVGAHQFKLAAQWARSHAANTTRHEARCRLLKAACYLDMRPLTIAIVSATSFSPLDVSEMRETLPNEFFRFVMGTGRLSRAAETKNQKAIVDQIHDIIVRDGDPTHEIEAAVSFVSNAEWDPKLHHTVLHWAVLHREDAILAFLINHVPGIDVNARDKFLKSTPLHLAATSGDVNAIKLLLGVEGIDVNPRDAFGMTPLSWAVASKGKHAVEILLKAPGIDVNSCDADDQTPLYTAVKVGCLDIIVSLLSADGINVNPRTNDQSTPLHKAVIDGRDDIVELLLHAHGIDLNARDNMQRTPLHWAAIKGYDRIVQLLLIDLGVMVNALDTWNKTALDYATSQGFSRTVVLLMSTPGVDSTTCDDDRETPPEMAEANRGWPDVPSPLDHTPWGIDIEYKQDPMIQGIRQLADSQVRRSTQPPNHDP